ncbi:hypothetical protein NXX77_23500 [Phocaeicola dorei]|nr:hypothetical protein [Phocaeicola dorei]
MFAKLPDIEQMNGMTNIAEYGKKPHTQYSEPVFSPFREKSINFVFANRIETAFFTVVSGVVQRHFFRTVFDLESATDK